MNYEVYSKPKERNGMAGFNFTDGLELSIILTLPNFFNYSFMVRANNEVGAGPYSLPVEVPPFRAEGKATPRRLARCNYDYSCDHVHSQGENHYHIIG